jgi:hypothetical protein
VDQAAPAHQGFLRNQRKRGKTQIWIAVSAYLLVAIVKKRLDLPGSLCTLLRVISVTLFEKMPISQALQQKDCTSSQLTDSNQLILFNF